MILSDSEIIKLCQDNPDQAMITPFLPYQVRMDFNPASENVKNVNRRVISYGLDPYGYDLTLEHHLRVFSNINSTIIDPKNISEDSLVDIESSTDEDGSRYVILPPNSYALGRSVERFKMPNNVTGLTVAKTTYARSGIVVPGTVLKAGWEGELVIEIANATGLPAKIYTGEGLVTVLFFRSDVYPNMPYQGLYQGQEGITLPRV